MNPKFPASWPVPPRVPHQGRFVELVPSDPERDAPELFEAARDASIWTYMPCGPFADATALAAWMRSWMAASDTVCFTVVHKASRRRIGMISIMRVVPAHGTAELGCIWYAPEVQRTPVNTDAVYLLLRHLFDELGYRRVEWKCDDRNERSKAAALRLGFQYEGLFRQHLVIKSENRDTAWFAMLDREWPVRRDALVHWLGNTAGKLVRTGDEQAHRD